MRMGFEPQRPGRARRIESEFPPPSGFITMTMELAMMCPAERHRELVADLAPERTRLREAQMVGIRRAPAANQTWLLDHVTHVLPVTNAALFRKRQYGLNRSAVF